MGIKLDLQKVIRGPEGQYLERKSLFEGPANTKRPRKRREVRDDVAEVVAAFANADGGILVLGVEDDETITGHAYPGKVIEEILDVPVRRLSPPQVRGSRVTLDGHEIVIFDVQTAPEPG